MVLLSDQCQGGSVAVVGLDRRLGDTPRRRRRRALGDAGIQRDGLGVGTPRPGRPVHCRWKGPEPRPDGPRLAAAPVPAARLRVIDPPPVAHYPQRQASCAVSGRRLTWRWCTAGQSGSTGHRGLAGGWRAVLHDFRCSPWSWPGAPGSQCRAIRPSSTCRAATQERMETSQRAARVPASMLARVPVAVEPPKPAPLGLSRATTA